MKKIIASDYDGTLLVDERIDAQTLHMIDGWRRAGNLFGLVTGRDRLMTKDALCEQGLTVDFLICNNGTVLLGRDDRILYHSCIPYEVIMDVIHSAVIQKSRYIVLADPVGRYVYDEHYLAARYKDIYYTEVLNRHNIGQHRFFYQMDTRYPNAEVMLQVTHELEEQFGAVLTVNPNVTTIDLTPLGVTKTTGLERYISMQGLETCDVITVGDGLNDLPMIEHYRGYTMEWAADEIKERAARGVVSSVAQIIEREI